MAKLMAWHYIPLMGVCISGVQYDKRQHLMKIHKREDKNSELFLVFTLIRNGKCPCIGVHRITIAMLITHKVASRSWPISRSCPSPPLGKSRKTNSRIHYNRQSGWNMYLLTGTINAYSKQVASSWEVWPLYWTLFIQNCPTVFLTV
jgi:hypothetical protein